MWLDFVSSVFPTFSISTMSKATVPETPIIKTVSKTPVIKKPAAPVIARVTPVMKKPAAASGKDSFAYFLRGETELDTGDASSDDGGTDHDGGTGSTGGRGSDKYTAKLRLWKKRRGSSSEEKSWDFRNTLKML